MIFESKMLSKDMSKFIRFVLLGLVVSIASMASTSNSWAGCGSCEKEGCGSSCGEKDSKKKDSDKKE